MVEIIPIDANFDHSVFKDSSCAFGVFDGVHRGHQYLLGCAQETAREQGGKSFALTFDIDPDERFHPGRLKKLMPNEDRIATLAETGVDGVIVLPFTEAFSKLSPQDFLLMTFNNTPLQALHVGSDFRFGARAQGTIRELEEWGQKFNTNICAHEIQSADGIPISSTRIRKLLGATKIEEANELLARPYFVRAPIHQGRGEGGSFGFHTANLILDTQMQALGDGVYAAYVEVGDKRYKAAVSVGVSPMFEKETRASCEVHILDFSEAIYGTSIKVEFLHFLRPMIKFESKEELISTVMGNIDWVRTNLEL